MCRSQKSACLDVPVPKCRSRSASPEVPAPNDGANYRSGILIAKITFELGGQLVARGDLAIRVAQRR